MFSGWECTVKTFRKIRDKGTLCPANPAFKAIELTAEMDVRRWGVVVWRLRKPVKR
ncbi:LexA family protein [Pontibacter sp. MBLB2868]|uniref:LexA family protein n=1 Tax=Pontibacter sp. MBLB2868 TaxID=3451555 RepID=UPI003F750D28